MPRAARSNKRTPSRFSSLPICTLIADWVRPSRRAASVTVRHSATATKPRSRSLSGLGDLSISFMESHLNYSLDGTQAAPHHRASWVKECVHAPPVAAAITSRVPPVWLCIALAATVLAASMPDHVAPAVTFTLQNLVVVSPVVLFGVAVAAAITATGSMAIIAAAFEGGGKFG